MDPLGHHLVLRLEGDRVLAPSPSVRRRFARVLAHLSIPFPVLAWRLADTHLHVHGALAAEHVDELTRRLRIHVSHIHPRVPLLLTRRVPVLDQWHLADAFRYVLRQDEHHGVGSDPYQEASAVTDLLGMRAFAGPIASRVREHLPRVRREHLLEHLGVTSLDEAVHVEHLADATCAAFALPTLAGRDDETVSARFAAVHACRGAVDAGRLAAALGITASSVRRMVHLDPPSLAVRASGFRCASAPPVRRLSRSPPRVRPPARPTGRRRRGDARASFPPRHPQDHRHGIQALDLAPRLPDP